MARTFSDFWWGLLLLIIGGYCLASFILAHLIPALIVIGVLICVCMIAREFV